ncbi:MAG: hypothetical protein M1499_07955 [Firmicutes bacterium]|nr:hypothetical protein [Bacillota bacterium]
MSISSKEIASVQKKGRNRRDMTYDEDRSQVRTGNEPRAMAILRNTVIGLLRRLQLPNIQRAVNHLHRRADQVATLLLSLTATS